MPPDPARTGVLRMPSAVRASAELSHKKNLHPPAKPCYPLALCDMIDPNNDSCSQRQVSKTFSKSSSFWTLCLFPHSCIMIVYHHCICNNVHCE